MSYTNPISPILPPWPGASPGQNYISQLLAGGSGGVPSASSYGVPYAPLSPPGAYPSPQLALGPGPTPPGMGFVNRPAVPGQLALGPGGGGNGGVPFTRTVSSPYTGTQFPGQVATGARAAQAAGLAGTAGGGSGAATQGIRALLGRSAGFEPYVTRGITPGAGVGAAAKTVGARLGYAGAIATGGHILTNLITEEGSDTERILGDAVNGAAIGTMIAPGWGTAIGAGVGALYGAFGPDHKDAPSSDKLAAAAESLGLDASIYTTQLELVKQTGGEDGEGLSDEQATQVVAQQILDDYNTKTAIAQQERQFEYQTTVTRASDQAFILAIQAQTQEIFGPYTQNILTSGQQQADVLASMSSSLPEPYRSIMAAQSEQQRGLSERMASAYAMQAQLLPSQYMHSRDLERQQAIADREWQMMVLEAQSGAGGGNETFDEFNARQQQEAGV